MGKINIVGVTNMPNQHRMCMIHLFSSCQNICCYLEPCKFCVFLLLDGIQLLLKGLYLTLKSMPFLLITWWVVLGATAGGRIALEPLGELTCCRTLCLLLLAVLNFRNHHTASLSSTGNIPMSIHILTCSNSHHYPEGPGHCGIKIT